MYYNEQEEINKDTLLADRNFLSDARVFLMDRGGYKPESLRDKEYVYDKFMEHFRFQNVNEATAISDMMYAQDAKQDRKDRMSRLMDAYDKMDSDFGLNAVGDYAAGIVFAPSTYAGIFTGGGAKVGALAAQQGVKLGIREVLKRGPAGQALRKAALKGAAGAGAVEAAIGATQAGAQEQTRVELGMQEEIRPEVVASTAAISAVPGAIFGAGQQTARAVTSNASERVSRINMYKTEKEVAKKKKVVDLVFQDEKTGKTAEEFYDSLMTKQLSLEESNPVELARGKKLQRDLAPDDIEIVDSDTGVKIDTRVHIEKDKFRAIAAVAAELSKDLPELTAEEIADMGGKPRFASRLLQGLRAGRVTKEDGTVIPFTSNSVVEQAQRMGVSYDDLATIFLADVSEGMSRGGILSGIKSKAAKTQVNNALKVLDDIDRMLLDTVNIGDTQALTKEARDHLNQVQDKLGRGTLEKARAVIGNIAKARVGLMTVQLATTSRNMSNGYMRNLVYGFDNLGQGLYNKHLSETSAKKRLGKAGVFNPTDEMIKEEAKRSVLLGQAQMKAFKDSVAFKDLLTITSAETQALARMMQEDTLGKSAIGQRLFMEMGDVADHMDKGEIFLDKGLLRLARFGNTFNSMSDNMFKRAILGRELNKSIMAAGYKVANVGLGGSKVFKTVDDYIAFRTLNNPQADKAQFIKEFEGLKVAGLNDIMKSGRFADIPIETVSKGMTEALDFTYQTSDFYSREGGFNRLAEGFIKTFQTPLGSTFIPFPRYLVNQFRFVYEHTPILGGINVGGILNKPGTKTGAKAVEPMFDLTDPEKFAKQATGFMTFTAMYALRETFGDETTGPFEYDNPYGSGTVNAEALLGPFSSFAVVADMVHYARTPERKNAPSVEDIIKALGGGQFRGTGLDLVDNTAALVRDGLASGKEAEQVAEAAYAYVGNYLNSFTVGAGMLKDMVATLDPEFRVQGNDKDINWFDYVLKQATRSLPNAVTDDAEFFGYTGIKRDPRYSPTKREPVRQLNPFMRQLTGLTQQEERNAAEKEFDRLGIQWRNIAPREIPGDPILSNTERGLIGRFVEDKIAAFVTHDVEYKTSNDYKKKRMLNNFISEARTEARNQLFNISNYATHEQRERVAKGIFFTLSKAVRDEVNAAYQNSNNGQSLSQSHGDGKGAYLDALGIAQELGLYKLK